MSRQSDAEARLDAARQRMAESFGLVPTTSQEQRQRQAEEMHYIGFDNTAR